MVLYSCFSSHVFSLTNGTTELFTLSSDSNTNTLIVQYLLMNEQHQTRAIKNVSLSNHGFHHIAVAVHDVQLTVTVDGLFKLRQTLLYPVDVRAENIFIGTLNDAENPTLQGIVISGYLMSLFVLTYIVLCVCTCVCVYSVCVRMCVYVCVCVCVCVLCVCVRMCVCVG